MILSKAIHIGRKKFGDIAAELAAAFIARVEADGGTVESEDCLISRIELLQSLGLWNSASAVWLPHGVKANKFYAVKGGTTADLSFTRAGTRSRTASVDIDIIATGLPALDYTYQACPSLSVEPARTNLLLHSAGINSAFWTKQRSTVPTFNTVIAPDGTMSAEEVYDTTVVGLHYVLQAITKSASVINYSLSVYLKPINKDNIWVRGGDGTNLAGCNYDVTTGILSDMTLGSGVTVNSKSVTPAANGYYRLEANITSNTATSFSYQTGAGGSGGASDGIVTNGFCIWGAQMEVGNYATSHITTGAATVSRIADSVPIKTDVASLIGQTEGTLYFEGTSFADATTKVIFEAHDGTTNNRIVIFIAADNTITAAIEESNVVNAQISSAAITTGTNYKVAFTYTASRAALIVNGVLIGEDLSVIIPPTSQFGFIRFDSLFPFYGYGKAWAVLPTALTDVQAIALTT